MLFFPTLRSGVSAQYPIRRIHRWPWPESIVPGGMVSRRAIPARKLIEWLLTYRELTDAEAAVLENFYRGCAGSKQTFTFADPCANLLSWSEDLAASPWTRTTGVQVVRVSAGFDTGKDAFLLTNGNQAEAGISQTMSLPGGDCVLSCWVRGEDGGAVTLSLGGRSERMDVSHQWKRVGARRSDGANDESAICEVRLAAGTSALLYGPQVEAQSFPTAYQETTAQGGIYTGARFHQDGLELTADGPNRHRATVRLLSRVED